jgi:protein involved in polysaccharide export with SLBB domain
MKKVLSAGLMLVACAWLLSARALPAPAPQTGTEVLKDVQAKNDGETEAKDAAAYYEIGMSHYEAKRFKEAVEAFKQAIRLGSVDPNSFFNLGQSYYRLNLYKEARESFKRAVRLKPDWAEAHYQLGWMYHILGDEDASTSQYKILQTLSPEQAASFQRLLEEDAKAPKEPRIRATRVSNPTAPATAADTTGDSVKAQEPASSTASAPDNASEQSPGATGSEAPAIAQAKNASANATGGETAAVGSPVKSETAAIEPVNSSSALPLTNIYRVGVGDVLDIRLLDAPTGRSTLFTVMSGGLIEYPLAGGLFPVAGLTTDEVAARLSAELKRRGINDNSQPVVGVRDYASHTVIVSGLVNYPGTRILRREAVPLYVIIAEAQLRPDASRAVIMRAGESIPIADLGDPAALNVLVKPGDVVNVSTRQVQYYFIGGRINSPGQKLYQPGLTLTQAILAAGGLSRSQGTVEISREEANGLLTTTKYVLKEIKSGKIPDPRLQPGDRIQVGQ